MLEVVNKIIEMSIQASFVICMILIVRFLFLKLNIPKQLIQILWVIPLFRLVCPVTIASGFSFMPTKLTGVANQIEQGLVDYVGSSPTEKPIGDSFSTDSMVEYQQAVSTLVTEGTLTDSGKYDYIPNSVYMKEPIEGVTTGVITEMISPNWVFMLIWLIGLGALIAYSIIATIRLRKKLVGSVWVTNNYYRADHIETPFVLGVIRPKVYLPSSMPEDATDMILQHENMHIRRKDHIVKLIVFVITCVYWFNPLAWVMYILFCRDMESAVDEKVVSKYDEQERKTYATLLLALSTGHQHLILAPLAFGEGDVKGRIKNVVKYKKPITILVVLAVVAAIVLAAGLLSSPSKSNAVFKGGKSINNVQYIGFFPALIPEEADAKDGYKITTDVIPFADKCFSPQLGEQIKANWKMVEQQHYASGTLVGSCYEYMDTWEACEAFIGFEIENPLKTCNWLVPADANTGMSLEEERVYEFAYPKRNHCEVHFYGDRKGDVEYVVVSEGYLVDDIRIIMDAVCYGENYPEEYGTWYAFAEDVDFEVYTLNRANGGSAVALFVPVDTRYSSNIYLAQNNVYYHISVLGDNEHVNEVRDVTAKLLKLFEVEAVDELVENFRTTDMEEETVASYGEPMEYWQNEDGTWSTENHTYQYCLKLFGAGNNAAVGTVYTVLSNDPNITFQETWLASGFSSNMADYFTPDYAVIAAWETYDLPGIYELPLYEYTGEDALLGAIGNYLVAVDLISDTSHGTIRIPAPVLLKIDDSDKTDIKVWGNFYSYGYIQDGTKLIMEIGGECPGIMHLAKTEYGYVVTGFEGVRDGSYFTDDIRELCKGHPGLYQKMMSISEKKRDSIRKELIEAYVSHNNLNITAYQDYGWEPVELDVKVDASAVTDAQILAQILEDKYADLAILPILDLDIIGEYVFDDRTFIVNNQVDNVLEETVYEYHLYRMMPDYEKVKMLVAEDTPLYGTIANEEKQFLEGKYSSEEELYAVDVFRKEDLPKISNYSVNAIQSMLIQYQLYEYAIVKVDYHVKYGGSLEGFAPQYGPGRHCMYYLIGRMSTRDDWKIYEAYRDEYFILE